MASSVDPLALTGKEHILMVRFAHDFKDIKEGVLGSYHC